MDDNHHPLWIDVKRTNPNLVRDSGTSGNNIRVSWQALFACQVSIRSFEERIKFKWGFSAAFLLEEALDRQKLFIESQYLNNPFEEQSSLKVLALRCIGIPKKGIMLSLIAKVYSESQEGVYHAALSYWMELLSVFPYDYVLHPAKSQEEFLHLVGYKILDQCNSSDSIVQIRRFESFFRTSKGVIPLMGFWQTSVRTDEQIWRVLSHSAKPIVLNVTLQPTILLEEERQALLAVGRSSELTADSISNTAFEKPYSKWAENFISRRNSPWNKFYFLQIHLAASDGVDDYLLRAIGSAITRDNLDQSSPGFQIVRPLENVDVQEWRRHLVNLDFFPVTNNSNISKISDIGDLSEAHAVFRFPYPSEAGVPGILFMDKEL